MAPHHSCRETLVVFDSGALDSVHKEALTGAAGISRRVLNCTQEEQQAGWLTPGEECPGR